MGDDIISGTNELWSDDERALWDDAISEVAGFDPLTAEQIGNDEWAQFLYHESMFDFDIPSDQREGIYSQFESYMLDTYDVDWGEVMDWEGYREAYDAA